MSGIEVNPPARVESMTMVSRSALHDCARGNQVPALDLLLEHPRIQVNTKVGDSSTAAHVAASRGHAEVLERLLAVDNINVNINISAEGGEASGTAGFTPLMFAMEGHPQCVKLLLQDRGEGKSDVIDTKIQNADGYTAFWHALQVYEHGGRPNVNQPVPVDRKQTLDCIKLLLDDRPDEAIAKNFEGQTPSAFAVQHELTEILEVLRDHVEERGVPFHIQH